MYTSATGMVMNQHRLDLIANNLANVNKTAFKADRAILKAFPQMLLHRTREDGLGHTPLGSFDLAPLIGRLGSGVEFNESFTHFEQGAARRTANPLDLMLDDQGARQPAFFVVLTDRGEMLSRNGSFSLDREGYLVTSEGFRLQGEEGSIQLVRHNFTIRENGEIWINADIGSDPEAGANESSNDWKNPVLLDQLKLRTVEFPRELKKIGSSFYTITPESGPMQRPAGSGPTILQGFLETSNVNLVEEMVNMIAVQRNYEANQRGVTTHDQLLGKLINEVAR